MNELLMRLSLATAAGAFGLAVLAPLPAGADDGKAAVVSDSIASGTVSDGGDPVAHADVVLIAWPSQEELADIATGDVVPTRTVAVTSTNQKGQFNADLDPADLPSWAIGDDGTATIEVLVADDSRQMTFNYSAEMTPPAQRASARRAWTSSASTVRPGRATAPRLRFDLGRGTAWDVANDPAKWLKRNGRAYGKAGRHLAARTAVVQRTRATSRVIARRDGCSVTIAGDLVRDRPEHFLNVFAWSGAPGAVSERSGIDHTLGIGLKDLSGHWSGNGTSTISLNSGASQSGVIDSSVWNRVNYRDYWQECIATYRRPYGYSDMLSNDWAYVGHSTFSGYCATKLAGGSWDTGGAKNRTYGSGIDIGPLNLSAQAGYNSEMNLHFTFNRKTEFCGTNPDGLLSSSQVEAHAY